MVYSQVVHHGWGGKVYRPTGKGEGLRRGLGFGLAHRGLGVFLLIVPALDTLLIALIIRLCPRQKLKRASTRSAAVMSNDAICLPTYTGLVPSHLTLRLRQGTQAALRLS